jgi:hypothetical protein
MRSSAKFTGGYEAKWGDKDYLQNSDWETSWKLSNCETRKCREDNIRMDLRLTGYKDRRCMELTQDHVKWRAEHSCSANTVLATVIKLKMQIKN